MGRDGLVFVNVRKDMMKLKRKANLAEAPFMEHGKSTTIRWSHWKGFKYKNQYYFFKSAIFIVG